MSATALDHVWSIVSFVWSVISFWAVWQLCDLGLSLLKVRLRKPWSFDRDEKNDAAGA